jgi:hypothetical protein
MRMKLIFESWRKYSNGDARLYHYSSFDGEGFTLDPQYFLSKRNPYSKRDYAVSAYPRVFFYSDLDNVEEQVASGRNLFYTDVSSESVYDIMQDPEGLKSKSRGPYGLSLNFDELFQNIVDKGYDGAYYTIEDGKTGVVVWFKPIQVQKMEL